MPSKSVQQVCVRPKCPESAFFQECEKECPARMSRKDVSQECLARESYTGVLKRGSILVREFYFFPGLKVLFLGQFDPRKYVCHTRTSMFYRSLSQTAHDFRGVNQNSPCFPCEVAPRRKTGSVERGPVR